MRSANICGRPSPMDRCCGMVACLVNGGVAVVVPAQQRLDALLQCVQIGQGIPELLLLCLWVVRVYPRWHSGRLLVPA